MINETDNLETQEDSSPEDDDVFQFETEHLALRGNESYANLLRTIAVLQAQRIRVHQQIEELEASRKVYLDNPQLLLDKLRNNEPLISDNYIITAELPDVPTLSAQDDTKGAQGIVPLKDISSEIDRSTWNPEVKSHKRSESFARLWTNEEQRHLEQLLIQYPPEEIEMRRFTKIAKALGNRTAQQVFSRVQKYFQKLHDAGMPVPGRIPKYRRSGHGKAKLSLRRSTFFPAQNLSLQMPVEDDDLHIQSPASEMGMPAASLRIKAEPKTEPEAVNEDFYSEAKRRQDLRLKLLSSVYSEKQQVEGGYEPDPLAPKCADCEEASVTRTHWRCNSCYCHLNLCGDCLTSQLLEERFEHLSHEVVEDRES
ncbi:ZZ-type zinc finger-containing protein 3 [Drosophila bipectinata]|uniref:ZZ-type zinc finger-containing protein 3 n=1 Tax=Drosophila bipectinata TaxID=42026 RepID=UPI001C897586|nr:ZZ-type zinc finger-containing protein 3 [Drosophila bipectinata]